VDFVNASAHLNNKKASGWWGWEESGIRGRLTDEYLQN